MAKVLSFGSLNIDYVYDVSHFVKAGETVSSNNMMKFCGGKGLNQSIALSRCGINVWHAGAVGARDGRILLQKLKASKVNIELVAKKEGPSGHAIIQKEMDGQNCIILFAGANHMITAQDVENILSSFGKEDFLIVQNEISQLPYIIELAKKKAMKIVLNPSPMNEKIIALPLEKVDYFILNEIEGAILAGVEGNKDEIIEALYKKFPQSKIVLTLGSEGSIYKDKNQLIYQQCYKVKAVDTTAAGDTFTGYFIGSIINAYDEKYSLDIAARASALAVTKLGAEESIPTLQEVMEANLSL